MLSPADADLVKRDPALPGLVTLLDPEAFVETLRPHLAGFDLRCARLSYVRYKPGMNCLARYQLVVDGIELYAYAKAHGPDAPIKLDKTREWDDAPSPLGIGSLVLHDHAISVYLFPNDRKLKTLPRLADPDTKHKLLRKSLPERPDLWEGTLVPLRYKPERRYVARLDTDEGPQAVLKFYTPLGYSLAKQRIRAMTSSGPLRMARRVGHSDRYQILAFEWLPGRLLRETLRDSDIHDTRKADAVIRVGESLNQLHTLESGDLPYRSPEEQAIRLRTQAQTLGHLCPHLAAYAEQLAEQIASEFVQQPHSKRTLHGDFYDQQLLVTDDSVAIIDLDEAEVGDPMLDLGLFTAHLERDALRGDLTATAVKSFTDALIRGYTQSSPGSSAKTLRLYTAIGLLQLAHDPFRDREPSWPERIEALLDRAQELLHGSSLASVQGVGRACAAKA